MEDRARKNAVWWTGVALFCTLGLGAFVMRAVRHMDADAQNIAVAGVFVLCVLIWGVAGVAWIFAFQGLPHRLSSKVRRDPRLCHACGYSLEHLGDISQCPECGRDIPWGQLIELQKLNKGTKK